MHNSPLSFHRTTCCAVQETINKFSSFVFERWEAQQLQDEVPHLVGELRGWGFGGSLHGSLAIFVLSASVHYQERITVCSGGDEDVEDVRALLRRSGSDS